ncbi:hypothetical protein MMC20_004579 [Loxospora ochrophaea]|nr:hypothetical protein [Loxospora ochrophaea]
MPLSYLQSALSSPFAFLPIAACVALALWVYPIRPREPAAEVARQAPRPGLDDDDDDDSCRLALQSSAAVLAFCTPGAATSTGWEDEEGEEVGMFILTISSPLFFLILLVPLPPPLANHSPQVSFALSQNQTQIVTRWIDKRKHQFSIKRDGTPRVRFCREVIVCHVDNWIVPHGHTQLSFPRTKWIREVPDPELEDWEGDVGMEDC